MTEHLSMIHSDSMPPTSLTTSKKFFQTSPLTQAARWSQAIQKALLGIPVQLIRLTQVVIFDYFALPYTSE